MRVGRRCQGFVKKCGNERKGYAQDDGVVLHEADVEPVRPMELDVRTYKKGSASGPSLVKDTHQRATLSTFREDDL